MLRLNLYLVKTRGARFALRRGGLCLAWAAAFLPFASADVRAGDKILARSAYESGVEHYHRGDFSAALENLEKSISEQSSMVAYSALAQVRYVMGDRARAAKNVERALGLAAHAAEDYTALGNALILSGEPLKAIREFNTSIQKEESADAYLGRGRAYHAMGEDAPAIEDWSTALKLDPKLLIVHYDRALAYYELGRSREATNDLIYTLRRNPKFPLPYALLGRILAEHADFGRALKAYSKALLLWPDYTYAHLGRAALYLKLGHTKLAFKDFEEAIRYDPGDYALYYNRGEAYLRMGKKDQAYADFRKALDTRITYAPAALVMGSRFLEAQHPEEAVQMFTKAYESIPPYSKSRQVKDAEAALLGLAAAREALGQDSKALKDLTLAVELSSRSAAAWTARGNLLIKTGDLPKGERNIEMALTLDNRYAPALLARASLRARRDQVEDALKDFNAAVEADPASAEAYNRRGVLYANVLRDYDKAVADLERAVALKPENAGYYVNLGAARVRRGDFWKAIEALDRALALKADPERVLSYRAQAHFGLGNRVKALADIDEGLKGNPKSSSLYATAGHIHMLSHEYTEAIEKLDRAISLDSGNPRAYLYRGLAYGALGEYTRAARDFSASWNRDRKSAEALTYECQAERLAGEARSAIATCGNALQLEKLPLAYVNRGLAYLAAMEFPRAIEDLNEGLRRKAPYAPEFLALSLANAGAREYRESDRTYREAMAWGPQTRIADINFGGPLNQRWDYYTRVSQLDPMLKADGDNALGFLVRGNALHNAGYYDRAVLEYTRALEIDGTIPGAYLDRGAALAEQQSLDSAEQDYRYAVRLNPKDPRAHLNLITLLTLRRKYLQALRAAAEALKIHSENSDVYVKAGNLRYFLKDITRAQQNYLRAIKLDPKNALAFNGLGLCQFARREYPAALENFGRAIAFDPLDDRYYRNRASAYVNLGDFANAAADFQLALKVNTDPEKAEEYRKLLQNSQARIPEALQKAPGGLPRTAAAARNTAHP